MIGEVLLWLLAGWLLADLVSGLLHWLEDRVLWVGFPLISRSVIEPNRLHHTAPLAFLGSGFFERNWTTWAAAAPIALAWFWLAGFSWLWLGAALGGLAVNEVHAQAHRGKRVSPIWQALQETGLVQSPAHHAAHHRGAQDRGYCILTDWLNPWLDMIGLWAGLERLLGAIGLEPNRGKK